MSERERRQLGRGKVGLGAGETYMMNSNVNARAEFERESATYILKWYIGTDPRFNWFIRGIKPDGTFYGEIAVFSGNGGRQITVESRFSESDYSQFLLHISEIEKHALAGDLESRWDGLLAEGPVNHPRIIYRYHDNNRETNKADACFMSIVNLFVPYMHSFERELECAANVGQEDE
jgi:hypothetical protein